MMEFDELGLSLNFKMICTTVFKLFNVANLFGNSTSIFLYNFYQYKQIATNHFMNNFPCFFIRGSDIDDVSSVFIYPH